jgi:2-methylcitrate dehydratase PrpD
MAQEGSGLTRALTERALAPLSSEDADRLRMLTATNVLAAAGTLGRAGALIDALPMDSGRSASEAAFLGTMALHARTQDDFYPEGRVHVGAITLAATLALAEEAGPRLLECLAAGYEAMCRTSTAYSALAQATGLRPSGAFGPIGAAASAAVALGLEADGVANAIGLAAALSGGTNQAWLSGTDEWLFVVASAARTGVEAALATAAGVAASPHAFEGKAGWVRAYFGDVGLEPLTEAISTTESSIGVVACKPYPVSGIAELPTELACRARAELGQRRYRSIEVFLAPAETRYPGSLNYGPLKSRSDALMSVPFVVAASLLDGAPKLDVLERPGELSGRGIEPDEVKVSADEALEESEARLELEDESGERWSAHVEGHEVLFPAFAELSAEAQALARRSEASEEIATATLAELGKPTPDARAVRGLLALAYPDTWRERPPGSKD